MAEYVEREALVADLRGSYEELRNIYNDLRFDEERRICSAELNSFMECIIRVKNAPAADVVEVVRCQDCVHAVPLDRNCELSTSLYMHCCLWRGDETKNVWHKYKKYYKDYSLVYRDDYCSAGVREDGADNE